MATEVLTEDLLAPHPNPKLEEHPLSAVRDCLFNTFAATLHIGGRSSIRNLRTRHALVTRTNFSRGWNTYQHIIIRNMTYIFLHTVPTAGYTEGSTTYKAVIA